LRGLLQAVFFFFPADKVYDNDYGNGQNAAIKDKVIVAHTEG
jgi:hypothetical protein